MESGVVITSTMRVSSSSRGMQQLGETRASKRVDINNAACIFIKGQPELSTSLADHNNFSLGV